jgi:hypothetical protein
MAWKGAPRHAPFLRPHPSRVPNGHDAGELRLREICKTIPNPGAGKERRRRPPRAIRLGAPGADRAAPCTCRTPPGRARDLTRPAQRARIPSPEVHQWLTRSSSTGGIEGNAAASADVPPGVTRRSVCGTACGAPSATASPAAALAPERTAVPAGVISLVPQELPPKGDGRSVSCTPFPDNRDRVRGQVPGRKADTRTGAASGGSIPPADGHVHPRPTFPSGEPKRLPDLYLPSGAGTYQIALTQIRFRLRHLKIGQSSSLCRLK